jgi:hypothetical protein
VPVAAAQPVPVVAAEPVPVAAAVPVLPHGPAAEVEERPATIRPDAADLLVEAPGAWGEVAPVSPADDVVPVLDLEHAEEDLTAWDDTDGNWLLDDEPGPQEEPRNRS